VGREEPLHLAHHRGHPGRVQGSLKRLRVRSNLIGRVINLILERAEEVQVRGSMEISPDPKKRPFLCLRRGKQGRFHWYLEPEGLPSRPP
jgi:hypothetical protein